MGHHKNKKKQKKKSRRHSSSESSSEDSCPSSPVQKKRLIGPSLPSSFTPAIIGDEVSTSTSAIIEDEVRSSTSDSYGPPLPPSLLKPKLPPSVGFPPDAESDDDVIGPLPAELQMSSAAQVALEHRAQLIKYGLLAQLDAGESSAPKREEWLTELPPEKANQFGLGPRKFRAKNNDTADRSNRSLWTETPTNKHTKSERKEESTDVYESMAIAERNRAMEDIVKKSKKKKESKSLLDIHREKLKKDKEKNKNEKVERRPFDRDADLQVNRFDEAQKRSILKKAQLLDSRFSQGKSKFL